MQPTDLRARALDIFSATLDVAHPHHLIQEALTLKGTTLEVRGLDGRAITLDLAYLRRVVAVGAGKATAPMARALEEILEGRLEGGIISVKYGHGLDLERVTVVEAGHPIPDAAGLAATADICTLLDGLGADDLAIVLISGGGSALLDAYPEGITLEDAQRTFDALLACGAPIHEMNVVRKHISSVKGGRLARLALPAKVVTLVLSDVIGDPLPSIASGPTVPDPSTFADAVGILERYSVLDLVPEGVRTYLKRGAAGEEPETPKPGDPEWEQCHTLLIGNNQRALDAAAQRASTLGLRPHVLGAAIQGEAAEVGRDLVEEALRAVGDTAPGDPPLCLVGGGETTVTLAGPHGKGGRNQEMAASAARTLEGRKGIVLLAAGTDGNDGPTDAAGGLVDGGTAARARAAGHDLATALEGHATYDALDAAGDLVRTGPTMTNVMDIVLIIAEAPDAGVAG